MDDVHSDEIASGVREMKRYVNATAAPARHVESGTKSGLPDPSVACGAGDRRVESEVGNRGLS